MAHLEVALLIQIAAACPATGVSADRVAATAQVESSLQSLAIGDNTMRRSYAPTSVAEAVTLAKSLLAQGHSIDAGVMQINSGNWARLGLTADTVFEPANNICAGKQVLAEAYQIERRVSCRYNSGRPDCTSDYPDKIARTMGSALPATDVAPLPPIVSSVIPVTSAPLPPRPAYWDLYGIARAAKAAPAQPAPSAPVQLSQR